MKKILLAGFILGLGLASCQKEQMPDIKTAPKVSTGTISLVTTPLPSLSYAKIMISLHKDSIGDKHNADGTAIVFNPAANKNYVFNEDAKPLQGSGTVSLANLSYDNVPQKIGTFPYIKGERVNLLINFQRLMGWNNFVLTIDSVQNVPIYQRIRIHDKLAAPNTVPPLIIGNNYYFQANITDTTTYKNRFSISFETALD